MTKYERAADAATGVAVGGWITSMAVDALPVIQALSGIAAIIASVFAVAFYIQRLLKGV